MFSTFLDHQWKNFWRGRNKAGGIAGQIFLGVFLLYFFIIAVAAGLSMESLLSKIFIGQNPITSFNGIIIYYFMLEFISRIQLQELPTLSIIPYLHLNISKNKIIQFLNIKALFSAFNIWPILLFFPFTLTKILSSFGITTALAYLIAVLSIAAFNNYAVLYIKRKATSNILYIAVGLAVFFAFGGLDYFKIISLMHIGDFLFTNFQEMPYLAFIPTLFAFGIYFINSKFLRNNLYVEELSSAEKKKASTDYPFLNKFGKVGDLAALELKLILRHKRPRSTLFMSGLFLAYGFIFYKQPLIDGNEFGKLLFAAIFMTGITILNYGQFMFAWQSTHFDGLLSNKINFKDFIKAKFLLFTISCSLVTICASFYGFLSPKLLLLHLAAYLYNIGFGSVLILYFATLNYKRLDITKSASMNFQGLGASQWIMSLPFIALPFLIYLPFGIYNKPYMGILALALFGLCMLVSRSFWVNFITKQFELKKYKIAEGFRE